MNFLPFDLFKKCIQCFSLILYDGKMKQVHVNHQLLFLHSLYQTNVPCLTSSSVELRPLICELVCIATRIESRASTPPIFLTFCRKLLPASPEMTALTRRWVEDENCGLSLFASLTEVLWLKMPLDRPCWWTACSRGSGNILLRSTVVPPACPRKLPSSLPGPVLTSPSC